MIIASNKALNSFRNLSLSFRISLQIMIITMAASHRCLAGAFVFVALVHLVSSATVATADIAKSIEEVQKKFAEAKMDDGGANAAATSTTMAENKIDTADAIATDTKRQDGDMLAEDSIRNNKMLDYYGYYSGGGFPSAYPAYPGGYQAMYPSPYQPYYSSEEYDDDYNSNSIDDEDEDAFSRANNRRKPGSGGQNSPIFYIRLPPTPYMFVPGMGYISQPPTLQPIAPQYSLPPPPPMPQAAVPGVSPFYNLPINFVSNGKPTGVYQWNGGSSFGPQFPSYLPPRPRPTYQRPPKPYIQAPQNSKVTHLKGQYLFNGRPEDIYLLPNAHYTAPYSSPYAHNPYAAPPSPYAGYPPVYHPAPIQGYY